MHHAPCTVHRAPCTMHGTVGQRVEEHEEEESSSQQTKADAGAEAMQKLQRRSKRSKEAGADEKVSELKQRIEAVRAEAEERGESSTEQDSLHIGAGLIQGRALCSARTAAPGDTNVEVCRLLRFA